jgi:hypothetical protein
MSWHPGGKKAMWPEILRGTEQLRLRIAELRDYVPEASVPAHKTPDVIPYGVKDTPQVSAIPSETTELKIAGRVQGIIDHKKESGWNISTFLDFSDDGKSFFNGYEKSGFSEEGEAVYEADLKMSGGQTGVMKLRLVFSVISATAPSRLVKDKCHGFAEYNGVRINAENMAE